MLLIFFTNNLLFLLNLLTNKKKLFVLVLMVAFSLSGFAQKKMIENYIQGEIYLENGQTLNVYIYHTLKHAEDFQNSVTYLTDKQYEMLKAGEKVKMKEIEELKTKEVKYYTLENGQKFNKVKYADLTAAGASSFPKYYFFEQLVDGKVSLYKKQYTMGSVVVGDEALLEGQELIDYISKRYTCLIQKENENAKDLVNIKIQDYVSSNPDLLSKLESGEYGDVYKTFSSRIHTGDIDYSNYENDLIKLISDFDN